LYRFLTFLQVDNIEDCYGIIKSRPKPLAAYLFTNNEQLKKDYVDKISSGGMLINDAVVHVVILILKFIHENLSNSNILFYKYDLTFINLLLSCSASIDNWKIYIFFGIFHWHIHKMTQVCLSYFLVIGRYSAEYNRMHASVSQCWCPTLMHATHQTRLQFEVSVLHK
jgi:hypothetical protein